MTNEADALIIYNVKFKFGWISLFRFIKTQQISSFFLLLWMANIVTPIHKALHTGARSMRFIAGPSGTANLGRWHAI